MVYDAYMLLYEQKSLYGGMKKFEKVDEEEFIFMCAPDIPERGVSSFRTHQQGIGEGYLYKEEVRKRVLLVACTIKKLIKTCTECVW